MIHTPDSSVIQITFQFTRKELFDGLLAVSISRPGTRVFRLIGIGLTLASFLIVFIDVFSGRYPAWYSWLFILFSLYVTFSPETATWFQAKTLVKRNAQITEPVTYTFNKTDYSLVGESFLTRMDYAKLYEVRETTDFILLKLSEGTAHVIPKRAVSVDQFAVFKEIIQSIPKLKSRFDS
ncbi:YcxB family protein [Spirosoma luteum]|uniref:YcxB family protein n=1 Tax=Spirosoma luteum TaxID=431553 RepID=UPI0003809665|nr:YcxB family protein [Spirosoma luteum]